MTHGRDKWGSLTGFRTWAGIIAVVGVAGGIVYGVMKGFFWTQEEQKIHQTEFNGHVTEFKSHEAIVKERYRVQEKRDRKIDAMYDTVIRLGVSRGLRNVRRAEDFEEESP